LEQALSTPIPHFEYIGHGNANYPYMFVGYRKLGGVALEDESITPEQLAALAPTLAAFLSELRSFPIVQAAQAGIKEHTPSHWRECYQELYTDLQERVFPLLDGELRAQSSDCGRIFWMTGLSSHSSLC